MRLSGFAIKWARKLPITFGGAGWLGFVIARLQVKEVAGYDEDVVFLVVPDGLNFGKQVLIVIGTCTLSCVINVIKESEID